MIRKFLNKPTLVWLLGLLVLTWSIGTWAQENDEDDEDAETEEEEEEAADSGPMEVLTVTGSRLKRSTYTNISPLQIITAEVEREAGLVDTAEILQKATQTQGQQIDLTFSGYVLDNGPSASTVALRGLDPDRTLVLINGRRLAPAGVEGAPSNPDLNLVPGVLVQQYELLLDGASSVYGSDAIAGVANIILRKDFDGLELDMFADMDEFSNKASRTVSLIWGKNYDRGFVGMAGTYNFGEAVTAADSPFTSGCTQEAEITTDGEVRTKSLWFEYWYGMEWDECGYPGLHGNWVTRVPYAGLLFYTPGESNGGWHNFSISRINLGGRWFWTDEDSDGYNDVSWRPYIRDVNEQYRTLYPQIRRINFMSYGEYTFEGEANITPFFEVTFGNRSTVQNGGGYQLFPVLHPLNPFNICNPNAVNGVDCGLAFNEFLSKQSFRDQVLSVFGCDPGPGGSCDLSVGPLGPWPVQPVVVIEGDRNITHVDVEQWRYVGGVRFDMPFMNHRSRSDWTGELYLSYSDSSGETHREGVMEDRFNLALGSYSLFGIPCDNSAGPQNIDPKDLAGCVPVNLFADSVLSPDMQGSFATQQERDYLFGVRSFDTVIEQTVISYYMTGNIFNLHGGTVSTGVGVEWRKDEIDSIPNDVAKDGKFWGFSADQGAAGNKTTQEAFAEIELPLLGNLKFANELTLNLSARFTDDQYADEAWTWSGKLAYRPFSSLLLRATKGTSYRGPNLRNMFLRAQTGFLNVFDPCVIPAAAIDPITGTYNPDEDNREEHVLENCRNNGVDPYVMTGFAVYNVEVASGGALDLLPETGDNETWGFSFEQPFTNAFDLAIGANIYKILVDDTIIEPSAGFIISDCYNSVALNSPFCNRITRSSNASDPRITYIDRGFINRDNETVRGIDFNIAFTDTVTIMDRPILLSVDYIGHKLLERSTITITEVEDREEYVSEWYFNRYRHRLIGSVSFNQMRIQWSLRLLGRVDQDDRFEDTWGNVTNRFSDTCLGPDNGDVNCRDIGASRGLYLNHSISFAMARQNYQFSAGIRNVTDETPPFVDETEVFSWSNAPLGAGYDLIGRSFYASMTYRLSGGL